MMAMAVAAFVTLLLSSSHVLAEDDGAQQWNTGDRTATQQVAMTLVVDVSGSMDDYSALSGSSKLDSAKKQSIDFVTGTIRPEAVQNGLAVRMGVVSFSDDAWVQSDLSADPTAIASAIGNLYTHDMTNIYAGIEAGVAQLSGADGTRIMVLLSDGLSNEGPGNDEILALAERARDAGISIYTIGFGSSGSIDEDLLMRIAQLTGGSYAHEDPSSLSSATVGLFSTLLNAQLTAAHREILGEATGSVAQGSTTPAGSFEVTTNGQLVTYLYWPGSILDLQLTDPDGILVDANYPSCVIDTTIIPSTVTINNAKTGIWNMAVYGRETSMASEPFYAVASFEEIVEQVASGYAGGGGAAPNHGEGLLFLLVGVAAASITGVVALSTRRR